MTIYIAREASKLWRRICMETFIEINLLAEKWKLLLAGLIFQYIHGLAARGVHYLHQPGPTLQDAGFFILPELGQDKAYISETLFTFIFFSFILWTFHPFIFQSKKFYTVLLWCRVLAFLVASQILRIITFYSTQLPGPNYHCREGSALARLPHPESIIEVLLINFPLGVIYGCGDLIFSSHMIFTLVFVLTYKKYGMRRLENMAGYFLMCSSCVFWISCVWMAPILHLITHAICNKVQEQYWCIKQLAWLIAIIQSLLIIAARKHYTVDIIVAWYTVNLVVFFVDKKLPELPDRNNGNPSPLIPLSNKNKDGRIREEHHKILNGNSGDTADWRQRTTQVNGKTLENGNSAHAETVMNGT